MQIKNFHYYNKTDALWNEPHRLHKKFAPYSEKNLDPETTFKQQITDLRGINRQDKIEKFLSKLERINKSK